MAEKPQVSMEQGIIRPDRLLYAFIKNIHYAKSCGVYYFAPV